MYDNHTHSPREIGAADDHDLTMLSREVQAARAQIMELERVNSAQDRKIGDLEDQAAGLHRQLAALAQQVTTIGTQTTVGFAALADYFQEGS